ncbi:MAG: S8 family serine peptidase [Acidobacteriota bacterium]
MRSSVLTCLIVVALGFSPAGTPLLAQELEEEPVYIVLLKHSSVAEQLLEAMPGATKSELRSALRGQMRAERQSDTVRSQQEFLARVQGGVAPANRGSSTGSSGSGGIRLMASRSLLLNMLVIRTDPAMARALRGRSEVEGVYPNRGYRPMMDTAPGVVGADVIWDRLGGPEAAGKGVKIGIIDTGIQNHHAMFTDNSLSPPAGYPKPAEFAEFTNKKVIVARNYVTTAFGYAEQPIQDPRDETDHGSHVAGIAAGNSTSSPYGTLRGIAPKAFLGNYKVFGDPDTNAQAKTAAILAALDDAVADEMDVINLSLGSDRIEREDDPLQLAVAKAVAMGFVVVVSAGNDGPALGTVGSPGNVAEAITVGASDNARFFGSEIEVTDSDGKSVPGLAGILGVPGDGPQLTEPLGPLPLASAALAAGTSGAGNSNALDSEVKSLGQLACLPLPANSLVGKVALVSRGECTFATKAQNITDAGGLAMIVYRRLSDAPFGMGGLSGIEIPAAMIAMDFGIEMEDRLGQGEGLEVTLAPQTELEKVATSPLEITDFSGAGPVYPKWLDYSGTGLTSFIKPDGIAPGRNIISASNVVGEFKNMQGTSMSAPVVAGGAALLAALHPNWGPLEIKTALMVTARRVGSFESVDARVYRQGNGLFDFGRAGALDYLPSRSSFYCPLVTANPQAPSSQEYGFSIHNLSSTSNSYQVGLETIADVSGVTVSIQPTTAVIGPGQSAAFNLSIGYATKLTTGSFEGIVKITPSSGITASMPYFGAIALPRGNVLQVAQAAAGAEPESVDLSTGSFSTVQDAVDAADPGDIVEIEDSSRYQENVRIAYRPSDAVPLHGLTLRGRAGQSPVVSTASSDPVVEVAHVRKVRLFNLGIEGGAEGIYLLNGSGIVASCRIQDSSSGILLIAADANLFDIEVVNSDYGLNSYTSSVLLDHGRFSGSGIRDFRGQEIDLKETSVSIFDSDFGPSDKCCQSVLIIGTPALLKGNRIQPGTGESADGFYLLNSDHRIQDNLIVGAGRYGGMLSQSSGTLLRTHFVGSKSHGVSVSKSDSRAAGLLSVGSEGYGLACSYSEMSVADSILAESTGDGGLAYHCTLDLLNTTIAGNGGVSILNSAGTVRVVNSILAGNLGGDMSPSLGCTTRNNLIQQGQFSSEDGDFSADPLFKDPQGGDFSLLKGSPAIDRSAPDEEFLATDYLGHDRKTDGDHDGLPVADLGALEYGPGYGPALILPVLSQSQSEFVGLAMANAFGFPQAAAEDGYQLPEGWSGPAHLVLTGYDLGGHSFGKYEIDLARGAQRSILLTEAFSNLQQGWIEITSSQPDLVSFTLLGESTLRFMDGGSLSSAAADRLVLPEIPDGSTRLFVVNPGNQPLGVGLTLQTGASAVTRRQVLPARGMLQTTVQQLFGVSSGGYVSIRPDAGGEVSAMELFGDAQRQGGLTAIGAGSGANEVMGAHIATGLGLETTVNLINLGAQGDVHMEILDESGTVLAEREIPAFGTDAQFRAEVGQAFELGPGLKVGWIRIRSDAEEAVLLGNVVFGDGARYLAALPLQSQGSREFILSHVAQNQDIFTGITLLNGRAADAVLTLEVFDQSGRQTGLVFDELKSGQKTARLLNEWIRGFEQVGGFIRVRSNVPLFGFELFGNGTLDFMAAVPAQAVIN